VIENIKYDKETQQVVLVVDQDGLDYYVYPYRKKGDIKPGWKRDGNILLYKKTVDGIHEDSEFTVEGDKDTFSEVWESLTLAHRTSKELTQIPVSGLLYVWILLLAVLWTILHRIYREENIAKVLPHPYRYLNRIEKTLAYKKLANKIERGRKLWKEHKVLREYLESGEYKPRSKALQELLSSKHGIDLNREQLYEIHLYLTL
jgi:hypothetical protein